MKKRRGRLPNVKPDHETVPLALKTADIDKGIAPLIKWMNEFDSVYTIACCQGEMHKDKGTKGGDYYPGLGENEPEGRPYVLFVCWDAHDLICILSLFHLKATVTVDFRDDNPYVRYHAEWPNRQRLDDTLELLRVHWGFDLPMG